MDVLNEIEALENGKGIKYLLDRAYQIFNNPVYMIDSNYYLIAASDGPMEISTWKELVTTGTYSLQVKEYMARASLYDIMTGTLNVVAKSKKPIYLQKDESRSYGTITEHIFNREKDAVASLVMYEYYSSFGDDSLAAFDALVGKIEQEIYDYEYFIKLPINDFEDMVYKLLDRTAENTIVNNSRARMTRLHFEKYLYLAVVCEEHHGMLESVQRSRLEYYRSLLKRKYKVGPFIYAIYSNYIVMLLGSQHGDYDEAMPLGTDFSIFEHNGLYAGVSGSFEDIFEFGIYYDQALAALKKVVKSSNGERVLSHK